MMRWLIAAASIALMTASAQAQISGPGVPGGTQIGQHASQAQQQGAQSEQRTEGQKKSEERAYNAALRNLPDKQYDPWRGVR